MGGRLIDADELIELIDDDIASLDNDIPQIAYDVCLCTLQMVTQYIKSLSTVETVTLEDYRSMEQTVHKLTQALAEAEPKHAYVIVDEDGNMECSNCGSSNCFDNYCGYCGAKLIGERDDEVEE